MYFPTCLPFVAVVVMTRIHWLVTVLEIALYQAAGIVLAGWAVRMEIRAAQAGHVLYCLSYIAGLLG